MLFWLWSCAHQKLKINFQYRETHTKSHPTMFRSLRASRTLAITSKRSVSYILPTVPLLETLRSTNQNFDGLYSNKSVEELWFQRGQEIVKKLNAHLEENKVANPPADLAQLIALTFNKPHLEGVCSQASLLLNLQFCLESLKPNEENVSRVKKGTEADLLQTPTIATKFTNEPKEEALVEWIQDSFGSIAEFRTLLLNSARSIKGDGVTWLVAQATYSESTLRNANGELSFNKLAVVNTYNAGIVDDSIRSGQVSKLKAQKKANEKKDEGENEIDGEEQQKLAKSTVLGSVEEAEEALLYTDKKLVPLLAIDGSMRSYLRDYGVFGKQQYLDNVWDCIDWTVVAKRMPRRFKPSVVFDN